MGQGVLKGLAAARQRQEERSFSGTTWVPELYLRDGDRAFVRFLSRADDSDDRFGTARVHSVKKQSKKGKIYSQDVFCTREDEGRCTLCDSEDQETKRTSDRLAVWVWIYKIWHTHQNPKLGEDDEEAWKQIRTKSGATFFEESIEAVQLFKKGYGNKGYIFDYFLTHFDRYGTMNDRTYEISRKGSSFNDTSYSIVPSPNESEIEDHVATAAAKLPSIELIFKNQVGYDQESGEFVVRAAEETVSATDVEEVVDDPTADAVAPQSALARLKSRARQEVSPDGYEEII